jgi:hypothetical protein
MSPKNVPTYTEGQWLVTKTGGLFRGLSMSYFLLVTLAREECARLFPNDPILMVEMNPLFGRPVSQLQNHFSEWFGASRGQHIYQDYAGAPPPRSTDGQY